MEITDQTSASAMENEAKAVIQIIEQLKNDNTRVRAMAMLSIERIANAIGPQRTRTELIPFLADSTDDDDEVTETLAEKLGDLLDFLGGDNYAYLLLTPLEQLCMIEESKIRDKAVASATRTVSRMTQDQISQFFIPLIDRLSGLDWYTSRISACLLIPPSLIREVSDRIIAAYVRLCKDNAPIVRRHAFSQFHKIAFALKSKGINPFPRLSSSFTQLCSDDLEMVRCLMPVNIAMLTPLEDLHPLIMPLVSTGVVDACWRVRWSFANEMGRIISSSSSSSSLQLLLNHYQTLLTDNEPEIRIIAASHLAAICKTVSSSSSSSSLLSTWMSRFDGTIADLSKDQSDLVRVETAKALCHLSSIYPSDATHHHLLPLVLRLMHDVCPQVRLSLLSHLHIMYTSLSPVIVSSTLLPAILDLAEDPKWRVRTSIIALLPLIAAVSTSSDFDHFFAPVCQLWSRDEVHEVRYQAANMYGLLAGLYHEDWVRSQVTPLLVSYSSSTALLVSSALLIAGQIVSHTSAGFVIDVLLPIWKNAAHHHLPTIRITMLNTVGKCLDSVAGMAKERVVEVIKSCLEDGDDDVKKIARQILGL